MANGKYRINEIYKSVQGEGARAGTKNVFLRFSGCNMRCAKEAGPWSPGGFDCDTEFVSGRWLTIPNLIAELDLAARGCNWIIATGGEPLLQLDDMLIDAMHRAGYKIAIETNGSLAPSSKLDYVACAPKVAEHAVRCLKADELRYVRGYGQAIPRPTCVADRKFISPAFDGFTLQHEVMAWCQKLVADNPGWELSVQQHKLTGVR